MATKIKTWIFGDLLTVIDLNAEFTNAITEINTKQDTSSELSSIAALGTTGLLARTAAATYATRTITATAPISVADGDGIAGAPAFTLDDNPTIPGTGGMVLPTGTDAQRGDTQYALRANSDNNVVEYNYGGTTATWAPLLTSYYDNISQTVNKFLSYSYQSWSDITDVSWTHTFTETGKFLLTASCTLEYYLAPANTSYGFDVSLRLWDEAGGVGTNGTRVGRYDYQNGIAIEESIPCFIHDVFDIDTVGARLFKLQAYSHSAWLGVLDPFRVGSTTHAPLSWTLIKVGA